MKTFFPSLDKNVSLTLSLLIPHEWVLIKNLNIVGKINSIKTSIEKPYESRWTRWLVANKKEERKETVNFSCKQEYTVKLLEPETIKNRIQYV